MTKDGDRIVKAVKTQQLGELLKDSREYIPDWLYWLEWLKTEEN
jgi:hypothetical protein